MLDTHPAHAMPDHDTIQRLSEKALSERVEVELVGHPVDEYWLFKSTSCSDADTTYSIKVYAPDPMGLDEPIIVHCTCPAGQWARPCKHSALALRTLNLDMAFSRWLYLTTEQAEQHAQTHREEATID